MERWPISPQVRQAIINRLLKVMADPSSSKREIVSAAKALMAAEKQNQEDQLRDPGNEIQRRNAELSRIASDLGLEPGFIEAVESGGVWHPAGTIEADADRSGERVVGGYGAEAEAAEQGGGDIHPGGQGPAAS